ncbi:MULTISPECIES: divalent-cation tolerance protein CutA [Actinomycetes]|uniref:Divalent cation tolerance protein n=1 Tax=Streptoalloteichus tenebrarius (strain ATCC 17920 / DSM 40477 / JCM 4838 / CBS 697.72 / NBRC 16177 / NCIMB 11028 / NRRL B-12390 / A12253. 1 / ISP 5477) TaxID=1933 RepID=A0ABT1I2E9_STRSD|nr:divalent-cation tolerance protein CutA [Streptoalloteichus tenebrarius]MCP2261908.1 divalent cation tolerance protein [Streptoalloteichus tenebrarius]BFF01030.1 divalent-cation tolerance protein CutA [Streptoalloteichus tenebrarius]GHE84994.1 divalent cation tolerance protein [Streptomyces griseoaurantiacus]
MSEYSEVVTTTGSAEAAEELARGIIKERLGACVHIVPIRSVYRWDGEVQTDDEWRCIIKTTTARVEELVAHIKANHSYDVPQVTVTPIITGNPDYLAWVSEETRPTS